MCLSESVHKPVLLQEVVDWLSLQPGMVLVDGTLGGGGHTRALAKRVSPGGQVIALDLDEEALRRAERSCAGLPVLIAQRNFCDVPEVLDELGIEEVDGILLDIGLSSDQLADQQRGFSFDIEAPLDMRFDPQQGEPAWRLLDRLSEEDLAELIFNYGEERYSRRIARAVVAQRRETPLRTTWQLSQLIHRAIPRSRGQQRIDPATRTFQALRIAVNDELKSLEIALRRLPDRLKHGGRIAVISFHSLEDRRVKQAFRDDPRLSALTRKPARPSDEEIAANPRCRSARLRVAERVD